MLTQKKYLMISRACLALGVLTLVEFFSFFFLEGLLTGIHLVVQFKMRGDQPPSRFAKQPMTYIIYIYIFHMGVNPKIGVFPTKSSILIGFFIMFTIHFGVPLFLETPICPMGLEIFTYNLSFIVGKYTVPFPWILWIYGKF